MKKLLLNYANEFYIRFYDMFSNKDVQRTVTIEIWDTREIIGMVFKVIPVTEFKQAVIWKNVEGQNIDSIIDIKLQYNENIAETLVTKHEVKGFGDTYFYVFKCNERKLWYKKQAISDAHEFSHAMLVAGRKEIYGE